MSITNNINIIDKIKIPFQATPRVSPGFFKAGGAVGYFSQAQLSRKAVEYLVLTFFRSVCNSTPFSDL